MELIGSGGFGKVFKIDTFKVRKYVSKYINTNEIHALEKCYNDSNVIKMCGYKYIADGYYIDMEYINNCMDLFDYINKYSPISEKDCKKIFVQIVSCIKRLYDIHNIIHGDIKDENILINPSTLFIKIIDFGSSVLLEKDEKTREIRYIDNTEIYRPPEYFMHYRMDLLKMTVWSLGLLLYDIMEGDIPFRTTSDITKYNHRFFYIKSQNLIDLIKNMLESNEEKRYTLDQVASDKWFH